MIDIQYIFINIHRLQVCQWAYNWSKEELNYQIRKMIIEKQWDDFFKRKKEEENTIKELIFEINNRQKFDISILKEEKNKSYGNKYIKRKYRY